MKVLAAGRSFDEFQRELTVENTRAGRCQTLMGLSAILPWLVEGRSDMTHC